MLEPSIGDAVIATVTSTSRNFAKGMAMLRIGSRHECRCNVVTPHPPFLRPDTTHGTLALHEGYRAGLLWCSTLRTDLRVSPCFGLQSTKIRFSFSASSGSSEQPRHK